MISEKMLTALNDQTKAEFDSAYLYLSMSAYLESRNLPGFANWMRIQFQEEMIHGLKIFDYIINRSAQAIVPGVDSPQVEFKSVKEVFELTLQHEQKVTRLIHNIYDVALEENDKASQVFLQWFIDEQVEEEKNATDLLETLNLIGNEGHALYMFDRQLATRTLEPADASE